MLFFKKKEKVNFQPQDGTLLMCIDEVIIDEKGQVGALGPLKVEAKEFDAMAIYDKNGELVEDNVIINELFADESEGQAQEGEYVSIMFNSSMKIKKGMYLVKK